MSEPKLKDVDKIPPSKRGGKWANRVEEFRQRNEEFKEVEFEDETVNAAYSGLLNVIKSREYRDEMRVTKRGDRVFLVTYDYWKENIKEE